MNIHCSACGAPLPQGARSCPACELPLTAIAMPTPAPLRRRKRPVSLLAICLAAFGIFWIVAYASDQYSAAHRPVQASATPTLTAAQIKADAAVDARYEREIDAEIWNSPGQLRDRLVLLAPRQDAVARHAATRIQARLRQLAAQ